MIVLVSPRRLRRGFTLIELMITIAIVGVLMALAVPALTQMVATKSVASQADEFASALRFARSEALKRSSPVTLCRNSGTLAAPTCATVAGDWNSGWVVFVDRDTAGTIDTVTSATQRPDQTLRVQAANTRIKSTTSTPSTAVYVQFLGNGIMAGGNMSFTLTPNIKATDVNYTTGTRTVCVNRQGRVRIESGTAACQ